MSIHNKLTEALTTENVLDIFERKGEWKKGVFFVETPVVRMTYVNRYQNNGKGSEFVHLIEVELDGGSFSIMITDDCGKKLNDLIEKKIESIVNNALESVGW